MVSGRAWARGSWVCAVVLALIARGGSAAAQVTQTDAAKTPLPRPVGAAEASLVNDSWAWNASTMIGKDANGAYLVPNIRYSDYYEPPAFPQFVTGDAINLSGLFKWRKETIDPVQDARLGPGYFSPQCGFSAELLLMGSNCQAQFGWYNVTDPNSKVAPAVSEIFPFMTGKPQDQLNCVEDDGTTRKTDGFCPLAWDNKSPRDLSVKRWTPKPFSSGDILKDPRYKGGYVGFAMIGDGTRCLTKYSMFEQNLRNISGVPWVNTLIYASTVDASGFYFAFENGIMSTADWTKSPDGKTDVDGDFNDLVFYVSGLACPGGSQPCSTGQFGACSVGRTSCAAAGETPMCRAVHQPSTEFCDNVDNDCNGVVDDGAALCPSSSAPICYQGACVASCKNGEFPCPLGTICTDSGRCEEPACAGVSCQPGSACHSGACGDPCSGKVCPTGSVCELGQCVNPCYGVSCASDRVCEMGACVPKCDCTGCATGLTCGSDGRCIDSGCVGVACPTGAVCKLGACIDPCAGVVCPAGGTCYQGTCSLPPSSGGAPPFGGNSGVGAGSGGLVEAGASGEGGSFEAAGAADVGGSHNATAGAGEMVGGNRNSTGGASHAAGARAVGGSASGASGASGGGPASKPEESSSCAYAVRNRVGSRAATPLLALVAGALLRRRRRRNAA
ncbi:MAG TPA: DUF4114 domain-containing protein [Polyangiaceae bacterium]|nr:DUF4114 domain-containing protein [Polyangiaceae bacterium]